MARLIHLAESDLDKYKLKSIHMYRYAIDAFLFYKYSFMYIGLYIYD